jgi:hypothetical protein
MIDRPCRASPPPPPQGFVSREREDLPPALEGNSQQSRRGLAYRVYSLDRPPGGGAAPKAPAAPHAHLRYRQGFRRCFAHEAGWSAGLGDATE